MDALALTPSLRRSRWRAALSGSRTLSLRVRRARTLSLRRSTPRRSSKLVLPQRQPGVGGCVRGTRWWFTDGYFRSGLAAVFSHAHCPGDRRVARPSTVRGVRVECRENARSRSRRLRAEWPQPSGLPRHMRATATRCRCHCRASACAASCVSSERPSELAGARAAEADRISSTSPEASRLATCYSSSSTVFSIPCRRAHAGSSTHPY